ncbi:immunity 50 family protein [Photobacterium damselae subsp. damselae]|nr:Imm50 family immunity protein [Photobacterium damselae]UKA05131.1 immunity 50 family protein [Photobacterium damselae subsp. damselae]UKA20236.1 immunity 50 family protein [Photobacterium damselae subsp. damselae]
MNWTKYLLDSNKIKAIFGDKIPSIEAIDLHEVLLNRDGPKVTFRFDLSDYPDNPPKNGKLLDLIVCKCNWLL